MGADGDCVRQVDFTRFEQDDMPKSWPAVAGVHCIAGQNLLK